MTKSYIIYRDVAVGANEDAAVTATGGTIDTRITEEAVEHPSISLELNRWMGDGSFYYAEDTEAAPFESSECSGADAKFATPPTITAVLGDKYTSSCITLLAGSETKLRIKVSWYSGNRLLHEEICFGDVCKHEVTDYDKVVITILGTSVPYRRARAYGLIFGIVHRIDKDELRSINITNECDPKAESLPVSSMTWTLDSEKSTGFMFQTLQPVSVYHEKTLIGTYYISNRKRTASSLYSIECEDAIGVLDRSEFAGGMYNAVSAISLVQQVVNGIFELDIQCEDMPLTGYLKAATRRECLQQIAIAWGVCISTDGTDKIRIFRPEISFKQIPASRTFYGVSLEQDTQISSLTVVAHSYTADESGSIEVDGVKYTDTETEYTKRNDRFDRNNKENAVKISEATLISADNAEMVLERLYDLEMMRATMRASFVWENESLGDYVTQYTPWNTMASGYITSMNIKLSNIVVADASSISLGGEAIVGANAYYSGEVEGGES